MQVVQDWSKLGSRVREARLASGLSQARLADRVGLDANEVVEIESGDRRVEATELFRLADTLALPIDHFLEEGKPVSAWLAEAVVEKARRAAQQSEARAAARELVAEYEGEHGPLPEESRQRARRFLVETGLLGEAPSWVAG